jgi:hypothetical protein
MASNVAGDPSRGVNWFEGGRRISKLFMAVVVGIGLVILIGTNAEQPTFFLAGPGEQWRFETKACKSPDYSRFATNADVGGESVDLCFEALPNGKIPYAIAPEPADAARERKEREAREAAQAAIEDKALMAKGEPPPIRVMEMPPKWYYGGDPYEEPTMSYIDGQVSGFRLTPQMAQQVRDSSTRRLWAARRDNFREGSPWVLGIVAAIWVFTAVMGWIVRGFAGVPMGADFRPRKDA